MKLALIIGLQQGNTVKPRLQGIKDNLSIDCFDSVPSFIDSALKRNSIYDRILVLSTKTDARIINDLYSYWSITSKETEVVLLSKSNSDEQKAQLFLDTFMTPVAAAMLVNSTTVQTIAEAVLRPTAEITQDYGIKDFLDVEIDEDRYVEEEPVQTTPVIENTEVNPELDINQNMQPKQNGKTNAKKPVKEKKGIFGSIFGKKTKAGTDTQEQEVQVEEQIVQESFPESQNYSEQQFTGYGDLDKKNPYEMADNTSQVQYVGHDIRNPELTTNESNDKFNNQSYNNSAQFDSYTQTQVEPNENLGVENTDYVQEQQLNISHSTMMQSQEQPNTTTKKHGVDLSAGKKHNVSIQKQSSVVDETFESTFVEVPAQKNDFDPEVKDVDMDFGGDTVPDYYDTEVHYKTGDLDSADESFEDDNVGASDEQYRQQSEAPRVITQTIVKEVVRNVNTGSKNSALNAVYSGRLKKVIVVTGDRGTGVTSTALNIANTLAKKVDVLYFDCDTRNHGLLNYIDYNNFKNYEQTHMNGVKLCKTSQAFNRCVMSFDENFYLLSTDFSCDTTDEELRAASEIVAEKASDFGVVVVDCPVDKLYCITDLVLICQGVICVEGSKRGFMNMLCQFESSVMPTRYKRTLTSRGTMLVTKCAKNLDLPRLVNYIKAIYEPDDVDWLATNPVAFNGKLTDELLNNILEG